MKLEKDTTISHYKILSSIGKGGMGEVYLAEDTKLDRKVALKILPAEFAEDKDRMSRFVREAKSASALNHPNIITIHEIGESEETHYIATEYIKGKTLNDYARTKSLKVSSVLDIAIQVASALDEAHTAGIVHRDIKPDNVMIRENGLVKILDFGIAKLTEKETPEIESEDATAIQISTTPGMIIGTANYMSPEQAKGKEVDARTDIFSFGVLLYEMLAGYLPFEGETAMESISSIIKDEPKPLNTENVPPEIERIISKALRKDRNERYQTIKGLLADLKEVKQELEFQDKLEKTVSPDKDEPKTQMFKATTVDEQKQTTKANDSIAIKKSSFSKIVIALMAVLLISAIGYFGYNYYQSTQSINSIAVLSFENKDSDDDTEYLSDGLAESLIFRLSQLPNLKVSPSSSVFRYKGKQTDAVTVGNELGVNAVLTGRIVQRGDSLNISVELVDVRKNKLIWGEKYERKLSELLATQRQIATDISQNLRLKLSGNEKGLTKPYTNSNEAYQLYLRGIFHFAKRTKSDMVKAIELFEKAVEIDPNFALADARIADVYNQMPAYPYASPKEAYPKAKIAAQRALQIDPSLSEAHTALANTLAIYDWNWAEAERKFKRAIELNPNNADAHFRYAQLYLSPVGRHDDAIREMKRALELEPLDLTMGAILSELLHNSGQDDKAIEQARKVLELEPDSILGFYVLAQALASKGMYQEAIEVSEKSLSKSPNIQLLLQIAGYSYAKAGRPADAEKIIEKFREIAKTKYIESYLVASIYVALGDNDKAFAELQKAAENRDWDFHQLNVDPLMKPLHDDPRFNDLVKKMNLPK